MINLLYILIWTLPFLTWSGSTAKQDAKNQSRPNILMLCIDDMNDWVGFLGGHPQTLTPHMDELSKMGVTFSNAHCPAPGCSPSRNAILFGIEPHNSGLYPFYELTEIEPGIIDSYTPLPLLFRNNGYTTCGLTKVFHSPDRFYLTDSIWDEYQWYNDKNINLIKEKGYYPDPYQMRLVACPGSNPVSDFEDYKNAKHAIDYLERKHEKPFFLAVGFNRPHLPFIVPEENYDRFPDPIQEPPIRASDLTDIPLAGQSNAQIYMEIPIRKDTAWEALRRGYLACINFIDDNVGRILNSLENSPYAENTIIILWSDHGYHLGEKRTFTKFTLWNEATRTPFIIYDPRGWNGNGKVCEEPIGLINIYRTLCDLANLDPPAYVDGTSLIPWLDNPELPKEKPALTTWGRGNYTLRTKEWRYTRYFDGTEELYSQTCDPNEWTNLASEPALEALKLGLAEKWLPKTEAPQVISGRALYNVADADDPERYINKYLKDVGTYKSLNLWPPLD